MKKTRILFLVIAIICVIPASVFAYETVDVYINGKKLQTDQPAIVYQDRTLVPVRAVAEALQCEVEWNGETETAHIEDNIQMVAVKIGSYEVAAKNRMSNQTVTIPIDVPAMTINDRTMLPLRVVAETFHADVRWDADTNSVYVEREYEYVHPFYDSDIAVASKYEDGVLKFGLVSGNGEVVIPCKYGGDITADFHKDNYLVVSDPISRKIGVIDKSGNVCIPFEYDVSPKFLGSQKGYRLYDSDLLIVYKGTYENLKVGVVDINNKIIIPCEYELIDCTYGGEKHGLLRVCKAGKWGLIAYDGTVLLECKYDTVSVNGDGSFDYGNYSGERKTEKIDKYIYNPQ